MGEDVLDKTVAFLAKRDGVDKVLKVIRYTSKLVLVTSLADSKSGAAKGLQRFEASVGTSRKAYRLGKWLADLNKVRRLSLDNKRNLIEAGACLGEGVYYFAEQFTWLIKAGALHKRHAARVTNISAWAEVLGYACSVVSKSLQLQDLIERERLLSQELAQHSSFEDAWSSTSSSRSHLTAAGGQQDADALEKVPKQMRAQLASVRLKRLMVSAAIVQDLADSLLALNDIRDGRGPLSNPALLCCCGLLSAFISIHKNWP